MLNWNCESLFQLLQIFIKFFLRGSCIFYRNRECRWPMHYTQTKRLSTLLATYKVLKWEYMNPMMIWTSWPCPETNCQQWSSFQSSLITNWNLAEYFLCTWSSSVSEHFKCYTVYLKIFFFPNWILSESSITELFRAVFPLLQANIKLCLTTYDNVFQTFLKCKPFCPICLPATLSFPPALVLPRHQHPHFSSAGKTDQAVITVTPTS